MSLNTRADAIKDWADIYKPRKK